MVVVTQVGKDIDIYWATGTQYTGLISHKFASGMRIGFANLMSYSVEHNVEKYNAPGRRTPWGQKPGAYDLTIHIEGLWMPTGALNMFQSQSAATGSLKAFALAVSGTNNAIAFSGCQLSTFDVEFDAEGWATETVDIPALTIR